MSRASRQRRPRCPTPRQLAQAHSCGDADPSLRDHLEVCDACAGEWQAVEELIAAARTLPCAQPDPARTEPLRTSLLVAAGGQHLAPRRFRMPAPRRWHWAIAASAVAAALLLAIGLRARSRSNPEPRVSVGDRRGAVQAEPGAHFVHTSTTTAGVSHDEVVRLSQGRVTVDVTPLARGERFRVITSDAEVEVHGTSFDVDVVDDQLVGVKVHSGVVEVRLRDRTPMHLVAGERWGAEMARADDPAATDQVVPDQVATEADGQATLDQASPEPPAIAVTDPAPIDHASPDREATGSATPADELPASPGATAPLAVAQARPKHRATHAVQPADTSTAARRRARVTAAPVVVADPAPADPAPAAPEDDPPPDDDEAVAVPPRPTPTEQAFQSGWVALRAANYGEAADAFGRAIAMEPSAPLAEDARYWKAVALARAGRNHDARQALAAYLAKHPSGPRAGQAAVMLGWLDLEAGDVAGARTRFTAATRDRNPSVQKSARAGLAALPQ